ncbi:hypothetical protein B0H19DRAFT_1058774 [Mycena capillaripes]|nr:hypothetical protein B0H19DRAFT_1058774 [Mycena capillaripes]
MAPISLDSTTVYPSPTAFYEPDPAGTPVAYTYTDVVASSVQSVVFKSAGPAFPDTSSRSTWSSSGRYSSCALDTSLEVTISTNGVQRAWARMRRTQKVSTPGAAFRPLAIALGSPRSATFGRSDRVHHHQQRPLCVGQADMLSRNGRGSFG